MNSNLKIRNISFSPPDMTVAEANEVRDAILSGWITTGPRTKNLENVIAEYVGVSNAVCLNSQTSCAEMALRLLGIGEGDEVIVPAYTYTASASVVNHVGAKIVFVDVQSDCLEMDYDKVETAITDRTKAIIPVDLGGIPCDYERLFEIVNKKKLLFTPKTDLQKMIGRVAICADCAHSFGGSRKGRMCGSLADFSSFSFHAVKNFTTAEGGALTWNLPFGNELVIVEMDANLNNIFCNLPKIDGETWNQKLYRITQLMSLHGQDKDAQAKIKLGTWDYDILGPWFKCNMTDVVAAIGLIQFERYPQMLAKRKKMITRYDEALKDMNVAVLKHYTNEITSSGHLYIVRLLGKTREQTNEVIEKMAERGIATNVHYKPLPMMTAYKKMGFDIKDFPNAFKMFENEVTLPLTTKMSMEDLDYVIENFVDIVQNLYH